ncbi:hypothetical protein GCM10010329_37500 [Streptomyces spiroverticillatus]|uniref:Lipoprotein n=1 Tax=Streptomyces finlayi TaxID=67296 RepID=A0A919CAD2_9ACTN|nr:hypothetical protein [Streptomyces finlayi]GHA11120.1 hypothetical protein GCM10010329_37500 [Streptomyces spiroverticillatus]GHC95163.1 hypothetical protein GCM10010334_34110 [Streptomyces finlayi]
MRTTSGTVASGTVTSGTLLRGLAAALLAATALTGCQNPFDDDDPARTVDSLPATPSGYGAVFLDVRECSSYGKTPREVSCGSERAAAKVTARYNGQAGNGPSCPATTDFVLHISESRPPGDTKGDENGDGVVPRGYACMRNLVAPHPGDPGGGGGPHTIVGDCLYGAGGGQVKETPCDGSGKRSPEYKVSSAVDARPECPPATRLYVQLGGGRPVGCARPV